MMPQMAWSAKILINAECDKCGVIDTEMVKESGASSGRIMASWHLSDEGGSLCPTCTAVEEEKWALGPDFNPSLKLKKK